MHQNARKTGRMLPKTSNTNLVGLQFVRNVLKARSVFHMLLRMGFQGMGYSKDVLMVWMTCNLFQVKPS
jgi:hypothetical protein